MARLGYKKLPPHLAQAVGRTFVPKRQYDELQRLWKRELESRRKPKRKPVKRKPAPAPEIFEFVPRKPKKKPPTRRKGFGAKPLHPSLRMLYGYLQGDSEVRRLHDDSVCRDFFHEVWYALYVDLKEYRPLDFDFGYIFESIYRSLLSHFGEEVKMSVMVYVADFVEDTDGNVEQVFEGWRNLGNHKTSAELDIVSQVRYYLASWQDHDPRYTRLERFILKCAIEVNTGVPC